MTLEQQLARDTLVSVIIPNYNNAQYLPYCLEALSHEPSKKEVIVVDDGSTDRSLDILSEFDVTVIRNEKNLGITKTRNKGASSARGSYLLFLDADTQVGSQYLATLAQFLDSHPQVGVVSGKLVSQDRERLPYNFGYEPTPLRSVVGMIFNRMIPHLNGSILLRQLAITLSQPFTLNFSTDETRKVDWVREMAFMTRASLFQRLGGFDEAFFMFYEGPDYCERVRNSGFDVYYNPEAIVTHLGGQSHSPSKRKRLHRSSKLLYYRKHPRLF